MPWVHYSQTFRDPFIIAVTLEDAAAWVGVALASIGIGLSELTGMVCIHWGRVV
jgi:hypothetical protein